MKKVIIFSLVIFISGIHLPAQNNSAMDVLLNHYSPRVFGSGSVTRAELDQIILAGIRAPSAMNGQPWHFTVVQNEALARQLVPQTSAGNVLILVSAIGDGLTNGPEILDCAIAIHSMYLAAQALGLGSRVYTNPVAGINSRFRTQLGLPDDHNVIAVIRIGRLPPVVDAGSSASPRHNPDRVVTYR